MTGHRADRGTPTVALTELADPPTLPSLPATELLVREGLPTKASRRSRMRGRAVGIAAGAIAVAGLFSVIHDNLLDHPTQPRPPVPAPPRAQPPAAVLPAPAALTETVVTTADPQPAKVIVPAKAAPAKPAAPKPAPASSAAQEPGWQQWIPPFVSQWWPR